MKQLSICLILFFCLLLQLHAQTKAIAFKSHSGNSDDFTAALENDEMEDDNFGLGPSLSTKLDSMKYVSKKVTVMYIKTTPLNPFSGEAKSNPTYRKDTIYNHPLFSRQHALDSIKKTLRTTYYFNNPVDSVQFIGFDNDTTNREKKRSHKRNAFVSPLFGSGNDDDHIDTNALLALGLTIGFLLPVSLLLRKVYHSFKNVHPDAAQSFT